MTVVIPFLRYYHETTDELQLALALCPITHNRCGKSVSLQPLPAPVPTCLLGWEYSGFLLLATLVFPTVTFDGAAATPGFDVCRELAGLTPLHPATTESTEGLVDMVLLDLALAESEDALVPRGLLVNADVPAGFIGTTENLGFLAIGSISFYRKLNKRYKKYGLSRKFKIGAQIKTLISHPQGIFSNCLKLTVLEIFLL